MEEEDDSMRIKDDPYRGDRNDNLSMEGNGNDGELGSETLESSRAFSHNESFQQDNEEHNHVPTLEDDQISLAKKRPRNRNGMRQITSLASYAQKWSELSLSKGRANERRDTIITSNTTKNSSKNIDESMDKDDFKSISDEFSTAILRNSVPIQKDTSITGKYSGEPREEPCGFVPSTEEACKKGIYEVIKPSFEAYQTDGSSGPSYDPETFNLMCQPGHVPSPSFPYPGTGVSLGAAAGTRAVLLSSITNMMSQRQASKFDGQMNNDMNFSNNIDMGMSENAAQHDDNINNTFGDTSISEPGLEPAPPTIINEKGSYTSGQEDDDEYIDGESSVGSSMNTRNRRRKKSRRKSDEEKNMKRNRRREEELAFLHESGKGLRRSKRSQKDVKTDAV